MQFQRLIARRNTIPQFSSPCCSGRGRAFTTLATSVKTMVSVQFHRTAHDADQRLTLSGACAATLPQHHTHDVILFGGYHESPDKQRAPTNAAWIFARAAGAWEPVQYTSGEVPQTRQATVSMRMCIHAAVMGHSMHTPVTVYDMCGQQGCGTPVCSMAAYAWILWVPP